MLPHIMFKTSFLVSLSMYFPTAKVCLCKYCLCNLTSHRWWERNQFCIWLHNWVSDIDFIIWHGKLLISLCYFNKVFPTIFFLLISSILCTYILKLNYDVLYKFFLKSIKKSNQKQTSSQNSITALLKFYHFHLYFFYTNI